MSDTAASFDDVRFLSGRGFAFGDLRALVRGVLGSAVVGISAVSAVGASAAVATVAGLWMVGIAFSGNPHLQTRPPAGPARLALADTAAFPQESFESRWARTTDVMATSAGVAVRLAQAKTADAGRALSSPNVAFRPVLKVEHEEVRLPTSTQIAKLTPSAAPALPRPRVAPKAPEPVVARVARVPLPRARPVRPVSAVAPVEKPAPQVAVVAPPPKPAVEERAAPREAHNKAPVLFGPIGRTALYDIARHTVYMPDGDRLEAHSGIGSKMDDPRFIKVRMRGPTPPNVYDLRLREQLFHGVRAIRLTPADEGRMFGRDGMLAHSYMLGPSGQSNGCVSFKDYDKFLRAFLNGNVDRMVVVRNLDEAPPRLASLARLHRDDGYRYAANDVTGLIP